jgi:hypothetical protein
VRHVLLSKVIGNYTQTTLIFGGFSKPWRRENLLLRLIFLVNNLAHASVLFEQTSHVSAEPRRFYHL